MVGYYSRFGFRPVRRGELTTYFRRIDRVARALKFLTASRLPLPIVLRRAVDDRRPTTDER
jgi:hypothetical protein